MDRSEAAVPAGGLNTAWHDVERRLRRLLPPTVAVAASTHEVEAPLFPEEQAYIAGASAGRRREFATARHCARIALAELGEAPQALPASSERAPQWPAGTVGSITHCETLRIAAASRSRHWRAVGIDAEVDAPLDEEIVGVIATDEDRAMLATLPTSDGSPSWESLLFSAKESVFKAWFPLTGDWLDFTECHLALEPRHRTFRARLTTSRHRDARSLIESATGGWEVLQAPGSARSWVFTYLLIPADRPMPPP